MANNAPQPIAEYTVHANQVKITNDIYCGSDTSKTYIRQFEREDDSDYKNRQLDCTIDNHVFRTVDTRKNIIFRKPIDLTNITNATLKEWCEKDIDNQGTSLNDFAKQTLVNADRDGFSFILTDSPESDENIVTALDEMEAKIRPYFVNIKRQDLFYWEMDSFGNYKVIAFNESYEVRQEGLFGFETKVQAKVLFNDGITQVYRNGELFTEWMRDTEEILLEKLGKSDIPLFYDMAKLNIKHLNRESEMSHYTRQQLSPFLAVYGHKAEGENVLAVERGLSFSNKTESGVEWIELLGNSHGVGVAELERLSKQMEAISISFNTETNIKTATQVEKDATEDESKLTDRATMLEDMLNRSIENLGKLKEGFSIEGQTVIVNKDFSSNTLSPEQQDRLLALYVQGIISRNRLTTALEFGEILPLLDEAERRKEETQLLNDGMGGEDADDL